MVDWALKNQLSTCSSSLRHQIIVLAVWRAVRVSAPTSTRRAPAPPAQSPTYERQISLTLGEAPHTRSYIRGRRFQQLPSLTKTQTPRAGMDTNTERVETQTPSTGRDTNTLNR